MGKITTNVVIRNNTLERLRPLMHPGQTYDGVITELLDSKVISPETFARLKDYRNGNESTDQTVKGVLDELDRLTNGGRK